MKPGERIVVFDLETGGLDPRRHPIIQIAALAVDHEWQEIEAIQCKLKFDPGKCEPQALQTNHYDAEVWEREAVGAMGARHLLSQFFVRHATKQKRSARTGNLYSVAALAGHNAASFDSGFLVEWYKAANEFCPAACFEVLDTLHLARWWQAWTGAPLPNLKLETLAAHFGIEVAQAHDALSDVRTTAALARALMAETFHLLPGEVERRMAAEDGA